MNKKTKIFALIIIFFVLSFLILTSYLLTRDKKFTEISQIDISLIPMYGEVEKTLEQKRADQEFIDEIIEVTGSQEAAFIETITRAEYYFKNGELDTAMKRYNQAWLINKNRPESYIGFGNILKKRGDNKKANEMYDKAEELESNLF